MLIDVHCHFNSLSTPDCARAVSSSPADWRFIDSSIDINSSLISCTLSQDVPFIYTSLGFHPFSVHEYSESVVTDYKRMLEANKKIVAIGEIGLDYKADISLVEQEHVLKIFLNLAKEYQKPVFIHNRMKTRRILEVIDESGFPYSQVVFHCFSYDLDFMQDILDRGGYLSFSLNILRKKKALWEALEACPLERCVLETDSPYMKIGERNSTPLDIERVYTFVAERKGIDQDTLQKQVQTTVKNLFSLSM